MQVHLIVKECQHSWRGELSRGRTDEGMELHSSSKFSTSLDNSDDRLVKILT